MILQFRGIGDNTLIFGNSKGKTGLNMEAVPGTCTVRIFSGITNPTPDPKPILSQKFNLP